MESKLPYKITDINKVRLFLKANGWTNQEIREQFENFGSWEDVIIENNLLSDFAEYMGCKLYSQRYGENLLQLHDNHTIWKLKNETIEDKDIEDFQFLVMQACEAFEEETGVEIFTEGRSGRHVCVRLNWENIFFYKKLQNLALKLEKWVIKEFNKD